MLARLRLLFSPFKARLSRHIALWVFFSIVIIELVIIIPSYRNYEQEQFEQLEEKGLATVSTASRLLQLEMNREKLLNKAKEMTANSVVMGGAIYQSNGQLIGIYGELPRLSFSDANLTNIVRLRSQDGSRYDVAWPAQVLGGKYTYIARLDASSIRGEVIAYIYRLIGLMVLICTVVTFVTLLALGPAVITPILRLRDDLIAAAGITRNPEDHANPKFYSLSAKRRDELGEVMVAFNKMIRQVSHDVTKLKDREIQLLEDREKELAKLVNDLEIARDQAEAATQEIKILNERLKQKAESAEQKAESTVRESEKRLAQFLEAVPVGVFVVDAEGKPYYANQRAKQLIGKDIAPEATTEELPEIYQFYLAGSEELYPSDRKPILRALKGESTTIDDMEIRQPTQIIPIEAWATPIYNTEGKIVYEITAFQDITERKKTEKLLADYNRTLEIQVAERTQELSQALDNLKTTQKQLIESEKMASLGGLVAGIAHEINTPIGIGVTASSTLAEATKEFFELYENGNMKRSKLESFLDTAMQSSSMILNNLNRAAQLIQSFKQVAVDQSSETKRTFSLKAYLEEILTSLRPKLKKTKHKVEIRGDETLTLDSYPGVLSQVFTNLIINSLIHAYSPEDEGYILLEFKREGEQIILYYSDDGKGIPQENLGKIFDPFFTTKRVQGGSGLGLHLVYNLVTQKLKGSIECDSQLGAGTSFTIKLPSKI